MSAHVMFSYMEENSNVYLDQDFSTYCVVDKHCQLSF